MGTVEVLTIHHLYTLTLCAFRRTDNKVYLSQLFSPPIPALVGLKIQTSKECQIQKFQFKPLILPTLKGGEINGR